MMTNEQLKAEDRVEAERYQVELVPLAAETGASALATLQGAVNKGARQSWRIVGVAPQDPTSQGILVVWDTSGFISG